MDFWNRVKSIVISQNTKLSWVAEKCDLNIRTFQGWITKEIMPNADQAFKIACALNTTVEYLITGHEKSLDNINPKIEELMQLTKQLPDYRIDDLIGFAEKWIEQNPGSKENLA